MRPGGIVYRVYGAHSEVWFESCFYLMCLSPLACCEAGVEAVVMTTVANDLQSLHLVTSI